MHSTRRFAAPFAALILALTPATVLAQSAGDEQYSDPFGDNEQNQGSGGSGSSSGSGGGGSGTAPSTSSGSAAQAAPATAAPAASGTTAAAADGGELPRTGLDAGLVAAIGAGLVGMGLVLRRRTADARR